MRPGRRQHGGYDHRYSWLVYNIPEPWLRAMAALAPGVRRPSGEPAALAERYSAGRVRSRVNASWINGQNRAMRPSAIIELTSPLEKKMPRLPCEDSSDCRNASSALSPSTIANTKG